MASRTVARSNAEANQCALIRSFCSSMEPSRPEKQRSVRNFFCTAKAVVLLKESAGRNKNAQRSFQVRKPMPPKYRQHESAHFIGIYTMRRFSSKKQRATKNIYASGQDRERCLHRRKAKRAAVTHNIKQSHCYFFPCVVIGW